MNKIKDLEACYYNSDAVNSTDSVPKNQQLLDTDPFGYSAPNQDPDGDGKKVEMKLRFPEQYYDVETGLFYNYFRDYNPATGRYIASDPIGLDSGLNTWIPFGLGLTYPGFSGGHCYC